jgi:hypothetical protein
MIALWSIYPAEIEIVISSSIWEFLDIFKFDISSNTREESIFSEESLLVEICHLIIRFSRFFPENSDKWALIRWENLEYTSLSIWPVLKSLGMMIYREDIMLRMHTHRDYIGHDIHIFLSWLILSEEWINRIGWEIPGFTHKESDDKDTSILPEYSGFARNDT